MSSQMCHLIAEPTRGKKLAQPHKPLGWVHWYPRWSEKPYHYCPLKPAAQLEAVDCLCLLHCQRICNNTPSDTRRYNYSQREHSQCISSLLLAVTQTCWGWWRLPRHRGSWSERPCCSRARPGQVAEWLWCRRRRSSRPRWPRFLLVARWWREWGTRTTTRMRRNSSRSCAPPAGGGVLWSGPQTLPGPPERLIQNRSNI